MRILTDLQQNVYFKRTQFTPTPVYVLKHIRPGSLVMGPAIIIDDTQTLVVTPDAQARVLDSHVLIDILSSGNEDVSSEVIDPATLSVFGHRFMSIAEQMGRTLQKTSVSLNIKERLDFSCALFGPDGMTTNNDLTTA